MAGGGIITTGNHPKAQWPGVKEWFGAKYDEHTEEYSQLFEVIPSSQGWEEDVLHSGFGLAPVKEQGKSVTYASHAQGYIKRYTHVVVALGYIVTREEIDDNQYVKVSNQRAESLAFSMRQTKENIHANIFNRAFNSSYTGGDGKELVATDHPSKGGDWSNELSPAADVSEQAIEDLCVQIMGATDEEGLNISIMPECVAVPRQIWFETNRILKSTLQNDSALNALNVLKSTNAIPQGVKINHYFTDSDAFFIKTNAPNGLKCYMRREIEFTRDNDFDTENAKAKATERYIPGWSDPRSVYGSPGA